MALDLVLGGQIPAHVAANRQRLNLNEAAQANLDIGGYAVLLYKGAQWSIRYQRETLLLDVSPGIGHDGRALPPQAVPTLDVVICGVARAVSKTWYRETFVEGSNARPDCAAVNGQYPDAGVPDPQNESCALCEHNRWGTATTGSGRGKACKDNKRIALVPAGDERNADYGGPMMLRIPPASLQNWDRYVREIAKHGADLSEVVTRLSFQKGLSFPVIEFHAVAWLDEEPMTIVAEHAASDLVQRMLTDTNAEANIDPQPPASVAQLPPRPTGRTNAPAAAPPAPAPAPTPTSPRAPVSPFAAAKAAAQASKPVPPPSGAAAETRRQMEELTGVVETPPKPRGAVPLDDPNRPRNRTAPAPVTKTKSNGNDVPTVVKGLPDEMASIIDGMLGETSDEEE